MMGWLLLSVQLALLWWMVASSGGSGAITVWDRYANPVAIFSMFYGLYFVLPQVHGLANDWFLVGYSGLAAHRQEAFINAQSVLCVFLLLVWIGSRLIAQPEPVQVAPSGAAELAPTRFQLLVLGSLFCAGFLSYIELGQTLQEIDGFRSELVKTTRGRILTTVAFAGNYACAAFLTHFIQRKHYIRALIMIGAFGTVVAATGSRGRLMWPILIGIVVASRFRPTLSKSVLVGLVGVFGSALVLLDQITANIFGGRNRSVAFDPDLLFVKRNFDGFPNFALILDRSRQDPELGRLATGASRDFMNEFFPDVLARGVGFGATVPGWLYLSGGLLGLFILSLGYGVSLGLFHRWHGVARNRWAATTYLFGMSWYAAIGGNVIESLDKMVAAMTPGFILWFATTRFFQSKELVKLPEKTESAGETVSL